MALFGRRGWAVITKVRSQVIAQPEPVSIEAELAAEERSAYTDLAKEIGFQPAALVKERTLAFLQKSGIKVFPYDKVKLYLDSKFGKKEGFWGHTWGWCPLRESDKGKSDLLSVGSSGIRNVDNGQIQFDRPYHLAIPFPVLDLVRNLSQEVPGIHFFVSDMSRAQDHSADPFLAITTPGMYEIIVIAEWDEPSFRA